MLRVRIVEMQRSVIKQLGMNLSSSNILNQLLPEDWGIKFATANGFSVNGAFLGGTTLDSVWAKNFIRPVSNSFDSGKSALLDPSLFAGAGGYSQKFNPETGGTDITYGPGELVTGQRADSNIQALERVGLARTLAEPNLTATSGEPAKFLAGGEFPVPTAQEGNRVSVSFKPFGVGLGFTPIILSADRISLKISTEVSEISTAASFRQADTLIRDAAGNVTDTIRGLSIPGVSVRRAENTMELPSGRSMVMAGLIQQATRQSIEGLPGLKDLPVLGNLFRSRDFQTNETELVIIVTPFIVKSTTMDELQTPGDGYAPASDAAALLLGRMNRMVKPGSKGLPKGRYRAPIGHIVN
jgi:pilus assembly protein CpaC